MPWPIRRGASTWLAAWIAAAVQSTAAAPDGSARWEGEAQIPGAPPLRFVVDLDRTAGGWIGSIVVPGHGVKGAPLVDVQVDERGVRFGLGSALRFAPEPLPRAELRWRDAMTLEGLYLHAGLAAPLVLERRGAPQVDRAPAPTRLSAALAGVWRGRYELGGYARDVTLTLVPDAERPGRGELVVVGRRTTTLPIDHVVQTPTYLTLRSTAADIRIEGRWRDGEIDGLFVQGPFEAALKLVRRPGAER